MAAFSLSSFLLSAGMFLGATSNSSPAHVMMLWHMALIGGCFYLMTLFNKSTATIGPHTSCVNDDCTGILIRNDGKTMLSTILLEIIKD